MTRCIVEIRNPEDDSDRRLLMWCTVTDAPTTYGMTREEFVAWYQDADLAERLARVDEKGTSAHWASSWETVIASNYAGPRESHATDEDLWRYYVVESPGPFVPARLPDAPRPERHASADHAPDGPGWWWLIGYDGTLFDEPEAVRVREVGGRLRASTLIIGRPQLWTDNPRDMWGGPVELPKRGTP